MQTPAVVVPLPPPKRNASLIAFGAILLVAGLVLTVGSVAVPGLQQHHQQLASVLSPHGHGRAPPPSFDRLGPVIIAYACHLISRGEHDKGTGVATAASVVERTVAAAVLVLARGIAAPRSGRHLETVLLLALSLSTAWTLLSTPGLATIIFRRQQFFDYGHEHEYKKERSKVMRWFGWYCVAVGLLLTFNVSLWNRVNRLVSSLTLHSLSWHDESQAVASLVGPLIVGFGSGFIFASRSDDEPFACASVYAGWICSCAWTFQLLVPPMAAAFLRTSWLSDGFGAAAGSEQPSSSLMLLYAAVNFAMTSALAVMTPGGAGSC